MALNAATGAKSLIFCIFLGCLGLVWLNYLRWTSGIITQDVMLRTCAIWLAGAFGCIGLVGVIMLAGRERITSWPRGDQRGFDVIQKDDE